MVMEETNVLNGVCRNCRGQHTIHQSNAMRLSNRAALRTLAWWKCGPHSHIRQHVLGIWICTRLDNESSVETPNAAYSSCTIVKPFSTTSGHRFPETSVSGPFGPMDQVALNI